jgi:cytidyltransferase-like protein
MKIVLVTGGFDPIHSGHIAYIKAAKELGDKLIVGINSDEWLRRKKGHEFMPWAERATIVANLYDVDRVINFDDADNSAKDAIRKVRDIHPNAHIIFANGGDRTKKIFQKWIYFLKCCILSLYLVLAAKIKKILALGFYKNGKHLKQNVVGVIIEFFMSPMIELSSKN